MREPELVTIDVRAGGVMESQSGLQMLRPRIFGSLHAPDAATTMAAIVMHPTSNFMAHYLLEPLARRGIASMGLNSRYAGNDTLLLMERVIQDLGAGVRYLKERGFRKIFLIGNSGGAALASFYQAQAQRVTAHLFSDGTPTHLTPEQLPAADGIVLCAAHLGRSRLMRDWIDPSVVDERDPLSVDPDLDMYAARHGPPFPPDFIERFRAAQGDRLARIEAWVLDRLRTLRSTDGVARDQVFLIHRTHADLRCLDLTIEPNDRRVGSVWGDAREVNYSANAMGRVTSLTGFLSQWSSLSQADGPTNLALVEAPKLLLTYTADQSTFPSTRDAWLTAGGTTISHEDIVGGNHYLAGQPDLVEQVAGSIANWARDHGFG